MSLPALASVCPQVTRSSDLPPSQWSPQEAASIAALVAASKLPLSVVLVGVGDGPWDMMKRFDDALPERAFDNFQVTRRGSYFKLMVMLPHMQYTFCLQGWMVHVCNA